MTSKTEGMRPGEFVQSLAEGNRSIDNLTAASGQDLDPGEVCGRVLGATAAYDDGNTGDGTVGTITIGEDVEEGAYTLVCTAEAGNAGTFSVTTPSGLPLAAATVAVAYTSTHLNFTIADGNEDWDVGDIITITVAAGSVKVLALAGTDGTQIAQAVPYNDVDASGGAVVEAFVVRDAELVADDLTWPSGITAAQKAVATAQLATRGIILR